MKNLVTAIYILLCTYTFSQNINYIDSKDFADTYIGSIGAKHYFYDKDEVYLKEKPVSVLFKDASGLSRAGVLNNQDKERVVEVFVYKDFFYTITDYKAEKTLHFTLNKYDQSFNKVHSEILFTTEAVRESKLSLEVRINKEVVGITCVKKVRSNKGTAVAYNLESGKSAKTDFEYPKLSKYEFADMIMNGNLQMNIVFEYFKKTLNGGVSKKSNAILVSCNKSSARVQQISIFNGEKMCRSFKFCAVDQQSFVLGALVFKTKGGQNLDGYSVNKLSFGKESTSRPDIIINDKMKKQDLWLKKELKKLDKNEPFNNSREQKLKAIEMISTNNFLFISESQYIVSGGSTGYTAQGTGAVGAPVTQFSHNTGYWQGISYNCLGDVIFSLVNIQGKKVESTGKTINRLEYPKGLHYSNPVLPTFVYKVSGDEIKIYFNLSVKLFNKKVEFKRDEMLLLINAKTNIAVMTANMSDGKGKTEAFSKEFSELPLEKMLPDSFFTDENGVGSCLVYESQKPNMQVKLKKQRFVKL